MRAARFDGFLGAGSALCRAQEMVEVIRMDAGCDTDAELG